LLRYELFTAERAEDAENGSFLSQINGFSCGFFFDGMGGRFGARPFLCASSSSFTVSIERPVDAESRRDSDVDDGTAGRPSYVSIRLRAAL
jgi:hypothetical protein